MHLEELIAHPLVIAPPEAGAVAGPRIAAALGRTPVVYPAFDASATIAPIATAPILRYGSPTSPPRTASQLGTLLAWIGALGFAQAMQWESMLAFEDDVQFAPDFLDRAARLVERLPPDIGVFNCGPLLWRPPEEHGTVSDGLLLCDRTRKLPISCMHAVFIHRRALADVLAAMRTLAMTVDDLFAYACMHATQWQTAAALPPLAWQSDRPNTRTGIGWQ